MLTELETKTTTSFNKHLNITYVYNVTVFLDDSSGKRAYKRHLIGKLDGAGNIVPTRPKRPADRKKREPSTSLDSNLDYQALYLDAMKKLEMMKASEQRSKQHMQTIRKTVGVINEQLASLSKVLANY